MAVEVKQPDAIISSAGLDVSGTITYIQDDPDSPDANWFTHTAKSGSLRVSFPTPTGNPTTGADVQNFKLWLRKDAAGGGDPTYTAELRETGGGSALQTLATDVAVTSATGELETLTWDATNLGTADGSAVELLLTFKGNGGGPNERSMEVGAVEWNVDYVGATAPTVTTQAATGVERTIATGNGNVTDDGGATITERGVCWNTSTNPTTANDKATSAGTTGAFTADITGMTADTHYYARAYAINSVGTSYGDNVEFDTWTGRQVGSIDGIAIT